MFGQDDTTTVGIGIAVGVVVLLVVLFTLALLCGVLSLVVFEF